MNTPLKSTLSSVNDRLRAFWRRSVATRLTLQLVSRVVADTLLINLAILVSLGGRLMWIFISRSSPGLNYSLAFKEYVKAYGNSAWLLTLIILLLIFRSGLYTAGRQYRIRYKILMVVQAVSLAYLIFGLLAYVSQGIFLNFLKGYTVLPRGALLMSWVITMVLLIAARIWSSLWRRVARAEAAELKGRNGKIENVLVIGGAGYIGSALLPKLLESGYRVRILDLLLFGDDPIHKYLSHPNLEVVQADFRLIDKVVSATRDMDAVIHLGGIVGDPACDLDGDLTLEINLTATRLIAEVAKGVGVQKFIFASTSSVYGSSIEMIDERSELRPVSLYARSKLASERVLFQMADDNFSPVILRFGTVYGLSGRVRFDLVVNLLTAKALVDGEITVFGGGQWRPFVHVDDAAEAVLKVLQAPIQQVQNQIFNVGSNEQNYTVHQVAEMIQHRVPNARIVVREDNVDPNNYQVSANKIHKTLGFTPRWTVEEGIDQVIEAFQTGRVDNYKDARYSNVKFLSGEMILRLNRHEEGWAYQLLEPGSERVRESTQL